jgi:hypothetical protein
MDMDRMTWFIMLAPPSSFAHYLFKRELIQALSWRFLGSREDLWYNGETEKP